ncbi:porin [Vreelandella boliviensis]|uniref:Outer membrane pore protein E n=1 Tax=Vreelandella boliviensis LC1 TaxID=1072583 RepID=A0A265DUT1_9GAMM|nr:porin [Halomonas boliviensis]EHJ91165.1 Outer membrane pore protein E [Halomonas boliviensis LC1]OZT73067.1 porin [Halomonas boliviensis LC1]
MKKTLLATAIIGALGASAAAQAATVYDQDGTRLDIYGRVALGIEGGGPEEVEGGAVVDNSEEFRNVGSRLGLRLSHDVTSDLTAFARAEWRFDADERNSDGFNDVRHTYLGLQSDQFGTFQAGNFDSFYLQFVSSPFDVYIQDGFEFTGGGKQSQGDSIGYYTPDLNGFTAFLQAKHYSSRGDLKSANTDSEVAAQGGVRYAQGPVTIGLGFVDDIREGGLSSNDEMLYGLIGSYDFTDQFSARLGYETRDDSSTFGGGFDKVGLGATFTTGQWAFTGDVYDVNNDNSEDRTAWALGSYYNVSSNFDVFLELVQADQPDITIGNGVDTADGDDVYYITGARYHF